MKTTGMKHQLKALRLMNGRAAYALFMEMGTGKTWTLLADAERLFASGKIDAMLVIAPKGVHTNWVRREIPAHMDAPLIARAWKSGAGKRQMEHIDEVMAVRQFGAPLQLRILTMNIDALNTDAGFVYAKRFLSCTRAMMAIDESSRIKNPDSGRTKSIMRLSHLAEIRRIATGTPITKAPMDVFAQMEFLESGLLGTTSYRSFVSEYADLVSASSPMMMNMARRNPRAAHAQIVARNEDGTPRWRNLEKLQALLAPHSFRVLKTDCLDLPEKIYQQIYFDLAPAQQRAYELLRSELRIENLTLAAPEVMTVSALAALVKLQQITSGFVITPQRDIMYVGEDNPRLAALLDLVEDAQGKIIVWARFKEELRAIAAALTKAGRVVVEYHGGVKDADRDRAVDEFQSGSADAFVGQPQSGGIGLTLTAAQTVVYYSNDYNSETRKQSEDRAHRIGTKTNVVYIDLVATGTVDESIARSLQRKSELAAKILGDARPISPIINES
jgi:SNF2 family DNA or RNA helicase